MLPKSVLIKKYENRRLYDATNSRYVNLDEVARMVQDGCDVQVVDASSGEDITRVILTQIIAEGAKTSDSNFPLDILRQMVVASGRASQESAIHYTKTMLDLYQRTYRAMVPTLNPFDFLHNAQSGTGVSEGEQVVADEAAATSSPDEMAQLKARLAELEKAVLSMNPQRQRSAVKRSGKKSVR
jgi:polyhydroxyalkanoate synthesis repressor PhaR